MLDLLLSSCKLIAIENDVLDISSRFYQNQLDVLSVNCTVVGDISDGTCYRRTEC